MKQRKEGALMKEMGGMYNFMKQYFNYEDRGDAYAMGVYLAAAESAVTNIGKMIGDDRVIPMPVRKH